MILDLDQLVCPGQRSHPGEVFVLFVVAGSGFSQLLLTALAQEGQGHIFHRVELAPCLYPQEKSKGSQNPGGSQEELSYPAR